MAIENANVPRTIPNTFCWNRSPRKFLSVRGENCDDAICTDTRVSENTTEAAVMVPEAMEASRARPLSTVVENTLGSSSFWDRSSTASVSRESAIKARTHRAGTANSERRKRSVSSVSRSVSAPSVGDTVDDQPASECVTGASPIHSRRVFFSLVC